MTEPRGLRVGIDGVGKSFGPVTALSHVDIEIEPGEVHALLGENGAGKSTLVRLLAGDQTPTRGRILLDGEAVDITSPVRSRELGIGIVHQELSLFPNLSIAENLYADRLPSRAGMLDRPRLNKDAGEMMSRFGLEASPSTPVGTLSVARAQVVEILKAVGRRSRLIVFDEPTSALTGDETARLFELIAELRGRGVTVVYITHKLPEVLAIANRASVLRDGVCVGTVDVASTSSDRLVAMMVGREVKELLAETTKRAIGDEVLVVDGLNRGPRVRDVSFSVRAGEILGIAGVVGAGRSETLRAVFGIDPPRSGRITVGGKTLKPGLPHLAIAAGIGFVPEDRKSQGLFLGMTVRDNVVTAHLRDHYRYGFRRLRLERATTARMIEAMRIKTPDAEQVVGRLSGGNQQKVLLARWLTERPKVLLIDEPTRGIDVGARAEIYEVLRDLARSGVAIVMVSSELPELLGMSDRVLVMREGRLVEELPAGAATEEAVVRAATGGTPTEVARGVL